jgi:SPOR domain
MSDDIPVRTPSYRVERPRGTDPATRRLMFIAAGLGGALLVLIGAWSLNGGGSDRSAVPVIAPPAGPLRVKPANPGGMQVTGADQSIFNRSSDGRDAAQGSLMPAPERPDLQALRARAPTPAAAPAAGAGEAPQGGGAPSAQAGSGLPLPPTHHTTAPMTAAPPASSAPSPAVPRTATRAAAPTAAGGGTLVQLAALPTQAAAEAEWQALRHRLPNLLAGRQLVLARAQVGGREWWRVRTGGFASPAEAHHFCVRAHAAHIACDVTPF